MSDSCHRSSRFGRRSSRLALSVATASAGTLLLLVGASPAGATNRPADSQRVGRAPSVAGATRLGALAASTRLHVDVGLEPQDPAALAAYATAVSTPGSPDFHRYLTREQFANRYGPTATAVRAVDSQLRAEGLEPGRISANHLVIPVTASAGMLAKAFRTSLTTYRTAGGRTAYANTSAPYLGSANRYVESVIGLDDLHQAHRLGLERPRHAAKPLVVPQPATTSGPQPCSAAQQKRKAWSAYTANQIATMYNFQDLYGARDLGAGVTVAVFELEPNLRSDIAAYQSCYGTSATVNYLREDGFAAAGAGGGEAALDIEDIIGLAPKATIDVYEAPNTNAGVIDDYTAMVDNSAVKVISTSWGECEAEAGTTMINEEGTLFEQAAIEGQSVFAAAGDDGSSDCGTSKLAVDDPGSQPFVTSVGGTTTTTTSAPPKQTVWNDSSRGTGAGGGGISAFHTMPAYQSGARGALKVVNSDSSGVPCRATSGDCREVPDVSADADPDTGYLIYYFGGWIGIGGTSAAAPLWAAFTALSDASSTCAGESIGAANPALYAIAGTDYSSDFFDVTSGENDYTPDGYNGDLYPAGTGYDMASGLGTPNGANLPAALCKMARPFTTTSLSLATTTVTYGHEQVETFTVKVAPAKSGTPTGTVVVTAGSVKICSITLDAGGGACTLAERALGPGTRSIRASYSGDATYFASNSTTKSLSVLKAATATGLSLSTARVVVGHENNERFSVAVKPAYTGTPSGTVTVKAGSTILCTVKLSGAKGSCTMSASKLKVGTYALEAHYAGNFDFKASTSPKKSLTVT